MAREQGLSLLDIGVLTEKVQVSVKDGEPVFIDVQGISSEGVLILFQRFPEMQSLMSGMGVAVKPVEILSAAPKAIAAVIAAGCGSPGNPESEAVASQLSVEVQLDILEAISRLTFRSGFGPFVKRIVALSEAVSANYGRAPGTNSRLQSKLSEALETQPSGSLPPDR